MEGIIGYLFGLAIGIGILTTILAIASIFGPLLYPNLNLFTHLFK